MIMRFTTKRDQNGNRYYITIDTDNRTYKKDYNLYIKDTDITITKTDRNKLADQLKQAGYTEI